MGKSKTDCRDNDGITVSIIDAIITSCRMLRGRNLKTKAVREALSDIISDSDFYYLLDEARLNGDGCYSVSYVNTAKHLNPRVKVRDLPKRNERWSSVVVKP